MTRSSRGLGVFILALGFAGATIAVVVGGVLLMRSSIQFSRIERRLAELETRNEYGSAYEERLRTAASFARRPAEFRRLLVGAWRLEQRRWETVRDIASIAAARFRRDARWIQTEALAHIRLDAHETALARLASVNPAGSTTERLMLVAMAGQGDGAQFGARLQLFADDREQLNLVTTVANAAGSRERDPWWQAWQALEVPEFASNAGLAAALTGDTAAAREALAAVPAADTAQPASLRRAELYLAAWTDDSDRLFRALRSLEARNAVMPDVLLIQADGNLQLGRLDEAARLYRELRSAHPEHSWIPFANGAFLAAGDDQAATAILESGIAVHPRRHELRLQLASLMIQRGRRAEALRVAAPLAVTRDEVTDHRLWLILRSVLGSREPVERFEADLWRRLNEHPDASPVAAFLASFLLLRDDQPGVAELMRRYPPESGSWAATLHAAAASAAGELELAERLFREAAGEGATVEARNLALFALARLPQPDAIAAVESLDRLVQQRYGSEGGGQRAVAARTESLLYRAEAARLFRGPEAARELTRLRSGLNIDANEIYAYETLLAAPR